MGSPVQWWWPASIPNLHVRPKVRQSRRTPASGASQDDVPHTRTRAHSANSSGPPAWSTDDGAGRIVSRSRRDVTLPPARTFFQVSSTVLQTGHSTVLVNTSRGHSSRSAHRFSRLPIRIPDRRFNCQITKQFLQPGESVLQRGETVFQPPETTLQARGSAVETGEMILQTAESNLQTTETLLQPAASALQFTG
jgi:hypothetical protein